MDCQLEFNSLVIGYGSSLRNDDRVGLEVSRIVADWNLTQVRSLSIPQLVPELAAELAQVDLAIFIDAYTAGVDDRIKILPLEPSTSAIFNSHSSDPQGLLNLTQILYEKCPSAWWILVPGTDFELGDRLSPTAQHGIEQASKTIKNLLATNLTNNFTDKACLVSNKTYARSQHHAKYFRYSDRSSKTKWRG